MIHHVLLKRMVVSIRRTSANPSQFVDLNEDWGHVIVSKHAMIVRKDLWAKRWYMDPFMIGSRSSSRTCYKWGHVISWSFTKTVNLGASGPVCQTVMTKRRWWSHQAISDKPSLVWLGHAHQADLIRYEIMYLMRSRDFLVSTLCQTVMTKRLSCSDGNEVVSLALG